MVLKKNKHASPLIAAAFLMATSAIGPGFLTQTAIFTNALLGSFGCVILISILLDIGAQLNIWRILCVSGKRAQDFANEVLPGAGHFLTVLVVTGGLAFNCGNLAGAGLGLNVLTGWDVKIGATMSGIIAIFIFINKASLKWMDLFAKVLGVVMIALTIYVVVASNPPYTAAVYQSFLPQKIDFMAIITLVGGTVGGYISFAGAHRLIDAGKTGAEHIQSVSHSAISAVLLASIMRVLLFLAALGVVSKGISLNLSNPAADVFQQAAGTIGYKIFGIVMWSAAITSVVGSAYTSVSFLKSMQPLFNLKESSILSLFVLISLIIFMIIGQPVKILIAVGALNGLILPIALMLIIIGSGRQNIVGTYKHPLWLKGFGWIVVAATVFLCAKSFL